jgi:branched-chain amino acid transport system ATP-binding protein
LEKILECINISASYGHIQVLWDVNFSVNKNEITTIIGSNGAGKTTTFRTIAGLLPVSSGQIFFNNRDITNIPTNRRVELGITLVPEGRGLFPYMTVYENLKIGAYTKRARDNMSETIKWVFEIFPILKEKKNQLCTTLSGGEQQMLAIGRGLMAMPELLIIDEMTLGLAPKLVRYLFDILAKIAKEDVTILIAEQNVHYALRYSSMIYVIENGKIIIGGKSDELANNPLVKETYLGLR